LICSFNFLIFLAVCLNISTIINIKILTNSNQQIQSYKFTSHIAAFLSVLLITEMLEICIQTSYDQNVQLILKSYLPVVYGTPLNCLFVQSFSFERTWWKLFQRYVVSTKLRYLLLYLIRHYVCNLQTCLNWIIHKNEFF
jgi:hypothetical protein